MKWIKTFTLWNISSTNLDRSSFKWKKKKKENKTNATILLLLMIDNETGPTNGLLW